MLERKAYECQTASSDYLVGKEAYLSTCDGFI